MATTAITFEIPEGMSRDEAHDFLANQKHDQDGKVRKYRMDLFRRYLSSRDLVDKPTLADMTREQLVDAVLDDLLDGESEGSTGESDDEPKSSGRRRRSRGRGRGSDSDDKPKGGRRSRRSRKPSSDDAEPPKEAEEDPTPSSGLLKDLVDLVNTSGSKIDKMEKELSGLKKDVLGAMDELQSLIQANADDIAVLSSLTEDLWADDVSDAEDPDERREDLEDRIDEILKKLEEDEEGN